MTAHQRFVLAVVLVWTLVPTLESPLSAADNEAALKRHADVLKPIMRKHCFDCHSGDDPDADLDLEGAFTSLSKVENKVLWANVIKMIKFGEMPPEEEDQPRASEKELLLHAANGMLMALGADSLLEDLNTDPKYANHVNHKELFSGKHKGPAFTPSRLWYKKSDYANRGTVNAPTLDNLLKMFNARIAAQIDGVMIKGKLSAEDSKKMKAREARLREIKKMKDPAAREAALKKVPPRIEPPYALGKFDKEYHAFAIAEGQPSNAECSELLRRAFINLLRRPPKDEEELNTYVSLLKEKSGKIGRNRALKVVLLAIHLKPEVFYRMELGMGKVLDDGRRKLTPMETYYALCHAMGVVPVGDTGVKPRVRAKKGVRPPLNQVLLLAVYEDKLNNSDDIRAILKDYIGSQAKHNSADNGYFYDDVRSLIGPRKKILDFIREYFGYADAEDNFKDKAPNRPKELVDDADRFVHYVLNGDKDVLKNLLSANTFPFNNNKNIGFISTSRPRFKAHRLHYGVDIKALKAGKLDATVTDVDFGGKNKSETLFITFEERAGLLTHPVWNFAHSKNDETDPVIRGKWIREKLLAGTVREVPIQVDAKVPEDHTKTLRERFDMVVKNDYCWSCHKKMNPLGMPFESYDELGQFRMLDKLAKKPIDSSGAISGTGEADVDGEVKDAVELAHRLAKSTRVRQSFVRHAFRYWMGRNEMLSDSPTLMAADKAYVESDGSMNALVLSLVTSDSFLYRK